MAVVSLLMDYLELVLREGFPMTPEGRKTFNSNFYKIKGISGIGKTYNTVTYKIFHINKALRANKVPLWITRDSSLQRIYEEVLADYQRKVKSTKSEVTDEDEEYDNKQLTIMELEEMLKEKDVKMEEMEKEAKEKAELLEESRKQLKDIKEKLDQTQEGILNMADILTTKEQEMIQLRRKLQEMEEETKKTGSEDELVHLRALFTAQETKLNCYESIIIDKERIIHEKSLVFQWMKKELEKYQNSAAISK